jgi:hypothetical protein
MEMSVFQGVAPCSLVEIDQSLNHFSTLLSLTKNVDGCCLHVFLTDERNFRVDTNYMMPLFDIVYNNIQFVGFSIHNHTQFQLGFVLCCTEF